MTLQYSTQWDSLAHIGQLFDADGEPEIVFYDGYRAGEHIVGPVDYRGGREGVCGRSHFLPTAPPVRLPGAVGSPANAVATV